RRVRRPVEPGAAAIRARHVDRDDLGNEQPAIDGGCRAAVRLGGVRVEVTPAELPASGDELGRDALVNETVRVSFSNSLAVGIFPQRGVADRLPAHLLD